MAEPFVGQIIQIGFNYAPRGWALCNGQILPISQNSALFALLGTTFGGNGTSTFGLPDLRGRVPVHPGTGPGLVPIELGEVGGAQAIVLTQSQMPLHTHTAVFTPTGGGGGGPLEVDVEIDVANTSTGNVSDPTNNILAVPKLSGPGTITAFQPVSAKTGTLGGVNVTVSGGGGGITGGTVANASAGNSMPIQTLPPYLGINYVIALVGLFPSRN